MTNQHIYYEKYIKYKQKYLELKKLIGEANEHIILVATHNYRLLCILNKLRIHSLNINIQIKRFKNCAIVKIFNKNGITCVQLIYEGIQNQTKENKLDSAYYQETDRNQIILEINNPEYQIDSNKQIYLIRHGEGIHNILTKPQEKELKDTGNIKGNNQNYKDAILTKEGNNQAIIAGNFLNDYFNTYFKLSQKKNFNNKYYFCASDLYRTRETIGNIKYILNKTIKGSFSEPIFVLSCIHEISPLQHQTNSTEHDCDNSKKLLNPPNIYNSSICNNNNLAQPLCSSIFKKFGNISYQTRIDWSKYKSRDNCSKNNINIIKEILSVIPGK
jgi:hypothetical protein